MRQMQRPGAKPLPVAASSRAGPRDVADRGGTCVCVSLGILGATDADRIEHDEKGTSALRAHVSGPLLWWPAALGARLSRQIHEHGAKLLRCVHRSWKGEPAPLIALGEIATLGVEPGELPWTGRCAEKRRRIKRNRLGVILVHMSEGALLGRDELLCVPDLGQQLRARQLRRARKSAVEMGLRRIEPPEGEIGKAGVKRSLRMSGKEAP